jgi:hypothetical protein
MNISGSTVEEEDDDDEIVFLEERNVDNSSYSNLPHLRANCLFHKFCAPTFELFCQNCYCYCCDTRASDCKKWKSHCEATDQGPLKDSWKKFKLNEIDQIRIAEGRPAKKKKTILSFFQKINTTIPAEESLYIPITEKTPSSVNHIVAAVEIEEDSTIIDYSSPDATIPVKDSLYIPITEETPSSVNHTVAAVEIEEDSTIIDHSSYDATIPAKEPLDVPVVEVTV